MGRLSVLLTTEATYPFHQGGVSTWCHTLTHRLPEMDFHLLAVIIAAEENGIFEGRRASSR